MYKLLLATENADVLAAFVQLKNPELLGFKAPRIVSSATQAMECLRKHHIDGIAFELPPEDEKRLMADLMENYPILPIFNAAHTSAELNASLMELRTLLNRINADFSNDDFGAKDMLQICRHDFLRTLLDGHVKSDKEVYEKLHLLRSRMDPYQPCVVVDMKLPENDNFMDVRWHYGNERLEVAIRNFFGAELNGMRMMPAVLPDSTIRLLCCPMIGSKVNTESMTPTVSAHVEDSIGMFNHYLGVELKVDSIQVLPYITSLAGKKL